MMTHARMLKTLKAVLEKEDFGTFPKIFFDPDTNEIFPFERIKDFCRYWLQKDLQLYSKFREIYTAYRALQLQIFDAIAVINREENRKKINPLSMVQFKIRSLDYVESISTVLNMADMLVSFCSSVIDEAIEMREEDNLEKDDKTDK